MPYLDFMGKSHIYAHHKTVPYRSLVHDQEWYDSVNGDCEIRYEESTQYDTARTTGERKWEALQGSNGCVEIAPDNSDTSTDLAVKDVNKQNVTWAGYYNWWPFVKDRIRYNEHYMDDYGDCKKAFVAMHEWGHAQRLAHSSSCTRPSRTSVSWAHTTRKTTATTGVTNDEHQHQKETRGVDQRHNHFLGAPGDRRGSVRQWWIVPTDWGSSPSCDGHPR